MRLIRPNSVFSVTAGGMIAVLSVLPAFAEFASDLPTQLPPYWVEADPTQTDDSPNHCFSIGRDTRSSHSTLTLKDSLANAPGLIMQESFGGFEPPRLSIRGSGLQSAPSSRGVTFLLDGFPLGLADGSFNSALIDPQIFDRIDFYRGDASADAAPAVLGGAFNLRTTDGIPGVTLHGEAGSFGGLRASLTAKTSSHDITSTGAASLSHQDGFRDHSFQNRGAFFGAVHRPTPIGCDMSVSVYHARASYDVPGPLTLAAAQFDPRSISADVRRDQPRRESALTQVTAQAAQQNSVLALEAGFSWLRSEDWFRQLQANGVSDSHSDDITFQAALTRRFNSANGDHLLRFGTNVSRGWRNVQRFRNDAGITGPLFGNDGLFATTAAVNLDGTAQLHRRLALTTGLTALNVSRDISDRLTADASSAPTTTLRLRSSALQPRARLTWNENPAFTMHASFATSTEPPTFDDLLIVSGSYPKLSRRSQHLDNQRADTWEIGTSGTRGAFGWDVVGYSADWRHEILRLADANGSPRGAVNAGPTQHRGVEASAYWHIVEHHDRLTLTTTATWNRFTFSDDPIYGHNRLAGAPPHQGSARLHYEMENGFFVSPSTEWTAGTTPVDHAGRLGYSGQTLIYLLVGWRKTKAWTVFAEIKNVLDRDHIASTAGVLDLARSPQATAVFLPGVGRSFNIGFEWNFR